MDEKITEIVDEVVLYCKSEIDVMERSVSVAREERILHFESSSAEEKHFLKNLSTRNKGKSEYTDVNGILHAGIPSDFIVSNDDLSFLFHDMKARCDAIQYEILRRESLPRKIIYKNRK